MLKSLFRKDLRRHPRLTCHWAVSVRIGPTVHAAHMLDISRGGCLIRPVNGSLFLKSHLAVIAVCGFDLTANLVGRPGSTWRFRFPVALSRDHFEVLVGKMSKQTAEAPEPGLDAEAVPALAWLAR